MINKKVHDMLVEIAKQAFPEVKHIKFFLVIENREMKSIHGDWSYPKGGKISKIRIFNLSRGTNDIIKTSIHELAHNTEYSIHKKTGHSKEFYRIYKLLLETAIRINLITLDDIKSIHDIDMLTKHHGKITAKAEEATSYKKDIAMVKIKNSYEIKDDLKTLGYSYNAIERCWAIEIDKNELNDHLCKINELTSADNIVVTDFSDLKIDTYGYLIVTGKSYGIKDDLKASGFIFNGFNIGSNAWVKKISMQKKDEEVMNLSKYKDISVFVKTM